ncbi:MAG: hypothetical protein WC716_15885 [Chitinophagaceae bacterium]|jgi:hypothetical protein
MKRLLIAFSFFFLITKSNAQSRLSNILDSVFCKRENFLRSGFNEDYVLFIQKDQSISKEFLRYIILDTPSIKCFKFYYDYSNQQLENALNNFQSQDILNIYFKKITKNKIKIIFRTQTINKELYELNKKSKNKLFIKGDEWEIILSRNRYGKVFTGIPIKKR